MEQQTSHSDYIPGSFPTEPVSAGFQAQRNLAREVYDRRDEYTKTQRIKIKIGSWNVAALPGAVRDLGAWFAHGKGVSKFLAGISENEAGKDASHGVESVISQEERQTPLESTIPANDPGAFPKDDEIGIYVLGLQEIVDVNSPAEALRPFNDPHPSRLWKDAMTEALPDRYELIAEHQLVGLLLLIYASPEIAPTISSVSATHVGTGIMGYMGNKGAVTARMVLGERTKIVFVNAHLAAGNEKANLDRRNWDYGQILQRTRFDLIDHGNGVVDEIGDEIGDEDFTFWFGDLNYRLGSIPGEDVRRLLMLHTRNEYDTQQASAARIEEELKVNKNHPESDQDSAYGSIATSQADTTSKSDRDEPLDPSEDPASLQTTIASLFAHDQLREQIRLKSAFHQGWREGPIKFLPTYKYDVGSVGMFDSSEKKRAPSWCDRILFRTRKDYVEYLNRKKEDHEKHKRDQEMKARGLEGGTDEVIFDYDPETDGGEEDEDEYHEAEDSNPAEARSTSCEEERLHLDVYTSHQRVLSSDHKPLDAIFTMEYDVVDFDRKAEIHQEVAREIDRAENEGRPAITVIFDNQHSDQQQEEECYFGDLRFREEKSITLTLANTSPVSARFSFLAKEGPEATPSWLRLVFRHEALDDKSSHQPTLDFALEPGDSMTVEVIAQVAHVSDLSSFNAGDANPDDVLILRVRNGRDHFIPVRAHWIRSCFGIPLDQLVRLPKEGARSQPPPSPLRNDDVRWSAPRELFRLTESLEENLSAAISFGNAYSLPQIAAIGWPFAHPQSTKDTPSDLETHHASTLLSLRDSLDTSAPISLPDALPPTTKTELLASTLLLFLSYMPGRLIPSTLWSSLSASLAEHERSRRPPLAGEALRSHILDVLSSSPVHSVSFTFVTFMLQRITGQLAPLNHQPQKKEDSEGGGGRETDKIPTKISSPLSPKSPDSLLKRARGMSLSTNPKAVRRVEIEKVYTELFLPLVFEDRVDGPASAKERRKEAERKRIVLEVFFRSKDED